MKRTCTLCQGTGIGQYGDPDTSRCDVCKGKGYYEDAEDDYEPDYEIEED